MAAVTVAVILEFKKIVCHSFHCFPIYLPWCNLHISWISRVAIYSPYVLLSLFGTRLLFYFQFSLLLLDLHTDFSGGGLVFPSLEEFSTIVIHIVKSFGIDNKAKVDFFFWNICFFDDPRDVGNLISGSSAFSKSSLNIWKSTVHILLKSGLENFEHHFASMWDECNCAVVWTFLGIAFLWDWNENWPFPVLWPLLSFLDLLAYWVQHFHSILL